MMPQAYRAALYLRLSKDDDAGGESESIQNQRALLQAYAAQHGYLVYQEYVDDGYSGTTFDRPGWQRLIRDVEAGRVNLLLTKDLSRLGRDYIAAGQYTELYFPDKGVRVIAVNDGFDTEGPGTALAPFQNIVNELYARDASKKIRSALRTKMLEGAYIGNFAPYGYQKNPENKNQLMPDPLSAAVVLDIFQQAANGRTTGEIAGDLNFRGILPPLQYRAVTGGPAAPVKANAGWTGTGVAKILRNPVYLGHIVQGKTTKLSFKSPQVKRKPREDWIVVPDMHTPLVSQALFDRARRAVGVRRRPAKGTFQNVFAGLVFCADCGRAMSLSASNKKGARYNLACGQYKLNGRDACSNHFMDYDALYQVVLQELNVLLAPSDRERRALSQADQTAQSKTGDAARGKLLERLRRVERIVERLYEDRIGGQLEEAQFLQLLRRFQAEQADLNAKITLLTPPAPECDLSMALPLPLAALTPAILAACVDKIEISQGHYKDGLKYQRIKIRYRFNPA